MSGRRVVGHFLKAPADSFRRQLSKKPIRQKLKFSNRKVCGHKPKLLRHGLVTSENRHTKTFGFFVSDCIARPKKTMSRQRPNSVEVPRKGIIARRRKLPFSGERMLAKIYDMNKEMLEYHCRRMTICPSFSPDDWSSN